MTFGVRRGGSRSEKGAPHMSNLLGVLGLLCILGSITVLAGWPWALLATGVILVAVAAVAHYGGDVSG